MDFLDCLFYDLFLQITFCQKDSSIVALIKIDLIKAGNSDKLLCNAATTNAIVYFEIFI